MLLSKLRSRNVYPVGVSPGFDPSHIAVAGGVCRWSGVAISGNFIQLMPSFVGIGILISTGQAYKIDSINGPSMSTVSGGKIQFISNPVVTDTAMTCGAIFKVNTVAPAYQNLMLPGGVLGFYVSTNQLNLYSSTDHKSTNLAIAINTPYFGACTGTNAGTLYFILKNLATGQTFTDTGSFPNPLSAYATNIVLLDDGSTPISAPGTAAICATNVNIGPQGLQTWAEDPWSFWYPDPMIDFSVVGSAAVISSTILMGQGVM